MDWKFEKICIQYLTQGCNVNNLLDTASTDTPFSFK